MRDTKRTKPFICEQTGEEFTSTGEAAEKFGLRISEVSNCLYNKRRLSTKGYSFRFIDEDPRQKIPRIVPDQSGEKNPFFGKKHSNEARDRMSKAGKQRIGEKNNFYGKTHSDEFKRKMSERVKEYFKNNNSYWKGKTLPEELKKKIAISRAKKLPTFICNETGDTANSTAEMGQILGINGNGIMSCLNGRYKSTNGYTFKFIENN